MKKLFLSLSLILSFKGYSEELQLIHDMHANGKTAQIFDAGSPYRILQDALYKNKINLRCLQKSTSALYQTQDADENSWKGKLVNFLFGKQKNFQFSDNPKDYLIFWNLPTDLTLSQIQKIPTDRLILFAFDPLLLKSQYKRKIIHETFSKVYTLDDDLIDDKKFFKFHTPALKPLLDNTPSFSERKLLAMVVGSKAHAVQAYPLELETIRQLEMIASDEFSFYGQDFHPEDHRSYKGSWQDESETLKNYRFSLCYESEINTKGYISDKIFNSFSAGTIPVYLGASNISEYIPKHCYIDRRNFKSHLELLNFLATMKEDTYNMYINSIRAFLDSKEAKLFTMDQFAETLTDAIRQ